MTQIEKHSLKILEYDKIINRLQKHAVTEAGKKLCSELMPMTRLEQVQQSQDETSEFVNYLFKEQEIPFQGLEEIRPLIGRASNEVILDLKSLNKIIRFLKAVKEVKRVTKDKKQESSFRFFEKIQYLEELPNLLKRLEQCVAGDDEMFDRASDELFSIRRAIQRTQENIKTHLNRIVSSKSSALQEAIITIRSGRYVVPVKAENKSEIPGVVHDTSGSGATVFIEPIAIVELNNKARELEIAEQDEIYKILRELTLRVGEAAPYLKYDAEILEELDFAQAKAKFSFEIKGTSPILNNDGKIILKKARHPLIPEKDVVPIYFELGTTFKTLVITGPNTGGKTVTLKTCGLFVLMAMSGLHIPAAEQSEISVFQQILADIGDEQSIEQNLSTFSSHLKQIIRIIEKANPSTLVLTDELGAGTDPSEGAALAISILDTLRQKGCHTVATTHYRELKGYALNTEGVNNACCEFDDENLQPTYRLLIGVPGVSNAFKISKKLGLDESIIASAEQLLSDESVQFEELVSAIEKSHHQAKEMEDEIRSLKRESATLKENLEEEKQNIEAEKDHLLHKANQEARKIVEKAQEEVADILETIRQQIAESQNAFNRQETQKKAKNAERLLSELDKKLEKKNRKKNRYHNRELSVEDIEVGSHYYSDLLQISGIAMSKPDAKKQIMLKSGVMTVNVPISSLRLVDEDNTNTNQKNTRIEQKFKNSTRDIISTRKQSFNSEIKLLGMTTAEALDELDRFIDDAVLANIPSIRIVHGKGTGVLRQAVHNTLKNDRRVKSFKLAEHGEGDTGVTIANF